MLFFTFAVVDDFRSALFDNLREWISPFFYICFERQQPILTEHSRVVCGKLLCIKE